MAQNPVPHLVYGGSHLTTSLLLATKVSSTLPSTNGPLNTSIVGELWVHWRKDEDGNLVVVVPPRQYETEIGTLKRSSRGRRPQTRKKINP